MPMTGLPSGASGRFQPTPRFMITAAKRSLSCVVADGNEQPYQSQRYGMSSTFGATFGARRRYLSMSLGFAVPARSRRKSSAARREPTFSATAAAMNWLSDTPSAAANSAAAFFTDVGSFNG